MRFTWAEFKELSPILTAQSASYRIKGKIYKAYVQSVLTYGTETWAKANLQNLQMTERMKVRWMCGVSLKDRKRKVYLYSFLGVPSVADEVRRGSLRWFKYLEHGSSDDCVSACRKVEVAGARCKRRNRKTSRECVEDDRKVLDLYLTWLVFRDVWRNFIVYGQTYNPSVAWKNERFRNQWWWWLWWWYM